MLLIRSMMWVKKNLICFLNEQRKLLIKESSDKLKKTAEEFKEEFTSSFQKIGCLDSWKHKTREIVSNYIEGKDKVKSAFDMINKEKKEGIIEEGENFKKTIETLITTTNNSLNDFLVNYGVEVVSEFEGPFLKLKNTETDFSRVLTDVNPIKNSEWENRARSRLRKQTSFVSIDNSKATNFLQQNNSKRFKSDLDFEKIRQDKLSKDSTVNMQNRETRLSFVPRRDVSPGRSFRRIQKTINELYDPMANPNKEVSFKKPLLNNIGSYKVTQQDISNFNYGRSKSPKRRFESPGRVNRRDDEKQSTARRPRTRQPMKSSPLKSENDGFMANRKILQNYHHKAQKSKTQQELLSGKHKNIIRLLFDNKLKDLDLSYGGWLKRSKEKSTRGYLRTPC